MTAFDALAADYDAHFTCSLLGGLFRDVVRDRAAVVFDGATDVLELNCGTGVDALWLARRGHRVLATDASAAMLDQARAALRAAGLDPADPADRAVADAAVATRRLRLEEVGSLAVEERRFDAVLSNFGGLNCVADLDVVLSGMAAVTVPGARALLCVMGPYVPWEWFWFLAHGQPRRAVRRLGRAPQWRDLPLIYPRPGRLRDAAARHGWATARVDALGAVVPPPFAESWARRHRPTVDRLARLERRWATNAVLVHCADHYLVELVRR